MATTASIDIAKLAALDLFRGLPAAALEAAAVAARTRQLSKGTLIFSQGEQGARAHALIGGCVRISQAGSDGAQIVMRFIGPGEMFGAVALFSDSRYPADATAITDVLEASWGEAELFELMGRHPRIGVNLIRIIGKRLQEAQDRVRELSTQRAEQRLAHAVLRLGRQAGQPTSAGTAIAFPLRRKDVAHICGTTLHTASRILTAWEKAGLLVSHKQHLTIRRAAEIARIAEQGVP